MIVNVRTLLFAFWIIECLGLMQGRNLNDFNWTYFYFLCQDDTSRLISSPWNSLEPSGEKCSAAWFTDPLLTVWCCFQYILNLFILHPLSLSLSLSSQAGKWAVAKLDRKLERKLSEGDAARFSLASVRMSWCLTVNAVTLTTAPPADRREARSARVRCGAVQRWFAAI